MAGIQALLDHHSALATCQSSAVAVCGEGVGALHPHEARRAISCVEQGGMQIYGEKPL